MQLDEKLAYIQGIRFGVMIWSPKEIEVIPCSGEKTRFESVAFCRQLFPATECITIECDSNNDRKH